MLMKKNVGPNIILLMDIFDNHLQVYLFYMQTVMQTALPGKGVWQKLA